MSLFERGILLGNLPRLKAWDQLRDTEYSSALGYEELYDLVLEATRDSDRAAEAATRRAADRLRQGERA